MKNIEMEYEDMEKLSELKKQAKALRDNIKRNQKIIDNPALFRSTIDELDFFIENIEE